MNKKLNNQINKDNNILQSKHFFITKFAKFWPNKKKDIFLSFHVMYRDWETGYWLDICILQENVNEIKRPAEKTSRQKPS